MSRYVLESIRETIHILNMDSRIAPLQPVELWAATTIDLVMRFYNCIVIVLNHLIALCVIATFVLMVASHFKMAPTKEEVREEHVFRNGGWDSTIRIVRSTVASVDRRFWYAVLVWALFVVLNYAWAQYNVGKIALLSLRTKNPAADYMTEYVAMSTAVREASWTTFLDSLVLPYTAVQHVIPWMVLYWNPK